ncbi:hypothetical protein SORBI_3002G121201 [Sorghum bicolor]|uniref:Uncharacterized protein n=1 Tax=Sorghum bicolor TaxID=4558 RepID=A0A1W0W3H1_SORBI|nr:hypothetical protein SORBI_3002G121201 [Sorghum bicolor]
MAELALARAADSCPPMAELVAWRTQDGAVDSRRGISSRPPATELVPAAWRSSRLPAWPTCASLVVTDLLAPTPEELAMDGGEARESRRDLAPRGESRRWMMENHDHAG